VSTRARDSKRRWLQSRRLLILAVLSTLLVVAVGSLIMWQLLGSYLGGGRANGAPNGDTTAQPLVVGLARTPGGPAEWRSYAVVFARLEEDIGRPVQLKLIQTHSGVADLLRSGEVDIALAHVNTYLELEQDGEAVLVVAPVIAGESRDRAVLVVARESEFETVQDLEGQRIVLEEGSLSSEGCARWILASLGATPDSFFGEMEYAESQDTDLEMVARGDADATCVRLSALAAWSEDSFRVIAESPEFGLPPIVARQGLDMATVARIRESLVSARTAAALPSTSALGGFLLVTPEDYDFSRILQSYVTGSESDGTGP
jgi:ABC-type phosphate/phosphonate transport system substrate-binding protein